MASIYEQIFNIGKYFLVKKMQKYVIAGEGNGSLLQCSSLEISMNTGPWWAIVHGVSKSWARFSSELADNKRRSNIKRKP